MMVLKIMSTGHAHVCVCARVCDTRWRVYGKISWMHELRYGKLNLNANAAVFLDSR